MLIQHAGWIKRFLYFATTAIILLAGTAACSQSSSNPTNVPTGTPITIGYSYPVSGDFAEDGKAEDQGYQLWANMVNSSGGILGHPVQLVKMKDDSNPDTVTKDYQTLITRDHVDFVLGPYSSLLTKAAMPVAQKYGYVLLEGSGGAPSVFQLNNPNHPTAFDVSLPVINNLDSFAYYIMSLPPNERPKTVSFASESDDPFTLPQVVEAQTLLVQQGKLQQVVPAVHATKEIQADNGIIEYLSTDAKNYTTIAQYLIQAHAEVVVLGTFLPDVKVIIQTFKKAHYFPRAIVATAGPGDGQSFIQAVGLSAAEGVFVPNGWYPQVNNFQNAEMVQNYLSLYGGTAGGINADTAEAFSAGQVMQQALTKAGKISNAALLSELLSDTFNTVQGAVKFDNPEVPGSNTAALAYLFQWQQGNLIPVFPPTAASAVAEYPNKQATVQ
jgi:branched-chain amino acid transport system substrate-binding protein